MGSGGHVALRKPAQMWGMLYYVNLYNYGACGISADFILKSIRQLLDFLNLGNRKSSLSYSKTVSALQKKMEFLNCE